MVGASLQNEALIRGARLSTILLFAVCNGLHCNRNSTTSLHSSHSAHMQMQFEYGISMTVRYQGKSRLLRGSMDYALWCGDPYDAEATFMVVEAKPRGNAGSGFTQLLVYMCASLYRLQSLFSVLSLVFLILFPSNSHHFPSISFIIDLCYPSWMSPRHHVIIF